MVEKKLNEAAREMAGAHTKLWGEQQTKKGITDKIRERGPNTEKKSNIAEKPAIMGVEMERDSYINHYWVGASSSRTTHSAKQVGVDIGTEGAPAWGGSRLGEISVRYRSYDTRKGDYDTTDAKILEDVVIGFDRDSKFNGKIELHAGDFAWIGRIDIEKLQADVKAFAERPDVKQILKHV